MAKSSSNGSGPFAIPQLSDLMGSFPLLTQLRANGGLPIVPLMELARTQAKIMSKCGDEIARFAEQRLDHDEALLTEMASCESWESLRELQAAWAAQLLKDYMEQSEEMLHLLRGAYTEAAAAMTRTAPAKKAAHTAKAAKAPAAKSAAEQA